MSAVCSRADFVPRNAGGEGGRLLAGPARLSSPPRPPCSPSGSGVHVRVHRGRPHPAAAPVPPGPHVLPVPLLLPLLPDPRPVCEYLRVPRPPQTPALVPTCWGPRGRTTAPTRTCWARSNASSSPSCFKKAVLLPRHPRVQGWTPPGCCFPGQGPSREGGWKARRRGRQCRSLALASQQLASCARLPGAERRDTKPFHSHL